MTQQNAQAVGSNKRRPLIIGLTGGIGSGKSTVANFFAENGITIVDADRLAHELVEPDQPAFADIVAIFGTSCVTAEGTLDRAWLRRQIHTDPDSKQKLESILHPRIRARMRTLLKAASSPYCIAVIPLLVETGQADLVDRTLVVDIPESLQRLRVAARDGLSDTEITDILSSQADRSTRLAAADEVINNEGDRALLRAQVDKLHAYYLTLAQ